MGFAGLAIPDPSVREEGMVFTPGVWRTRDGCFLETGGDGGECN